MKVLIQHCDNLDYIAADGAWTSTINEAHDFRYSPYAYEVINKEKFFNATVVFYYEDLGYSLRATQEPKNQQAVAQERNAAAPII